MNSKIKDANTDFLFEAILQLKSLEECYQFFEDLCTVSEIKALSPISIGRCWGTTPLFLRRRDFSASGATV